MDSIDTVFEIKLDNEKKQLLDTIKMLAFYVALTLGKGRDEGVYQKALCLELQKHNILYNEEETIPIMYNGIGVGYERLDIMIYKWNGQALYGQPFSMILELKATTKIETKNHWQLLSYMNYKECDFGAVINFNQGIDGQPLEIAYLIRDDDKPYIYSLTREQGILMNAPNYETGIIDDYAITQLIQQKKALKEKAEKEATKVLKSSKSNVSQDATSLTNKKTKKNKQKIVDNDEDVNNKRRIET
jgi:GxxExxY protein